MQNKPSHSAAQHRHWRWDLGLAPIGNLALLGSDRLGSVRLGFSPPHTDLNRPFVLHLHLFLALGSEVEI